jgi:hypothetical protein
MACPITELGYSPRPVKPDIDSNIESDSKAASLALAGSESDCPLSISDSTKSSSGGAAECSRTIAASWCSNRSLGAGRVRPLARFETGCWLGAPTIDFPTLEIGPLLEIAGTTPTDDIAADRVALDDEPFNEYVNESCTNDGVPSLGVA